MSGTRVATIGPTDGAYKRFSVGQLKRATALLIQDVPWLIRTAHACGEATDDSYRQSSGYRPPSILECAPLRTEFEQRCRDLASDGIPVDPDITDAVLGALDVMASGPGGRTLVRVFRTLTAKLAGADAFSVSGDHKGACCFWVSQIHVLLHCATAAEVRLPTMLTDEGFLTQMVALHAAQRDAGRRPTADELLAEYLEDVLLGTNTRLLLRTKPYGSPGFRDWQTYMALTDPGPGHRHGTSRNAELHGATVHCEHLERDPAASRDACEPYRVADLTEVARVRMLVSPTIPVTAYVGRPVFESDFETSLPKVVNMAVSASAALFDRALTEVKHAMDNLSATQAIRFMRAVAAAVPRDRHVQVLAAAFCVNSPIMDDRPATLAVNGGAPRSVSDRFQVGLLAIELVREGGFDKVTWDGAADGYPSKCVLDQLDFDQAVTLVHVSHEAGLLTYFSGGFRFEHLSRAVETGVDGVGVGGAQILRFMDSRNGHHGPFKAENVPRILGVRDQASRSVLGRSARVLARLDQMSYELSISAADEWLRHLLYRALRDRDGSMLEELLPHLAQVESLPLEDEVPAVVGSARRLLEAGTSSIGALGRSPGWEGTAERLSASLALWDLDVVAEELSSLRAESRVRSSRCDPEPASAALDEAEVASVG